MIYFTYLTNFFTELSIHLLIHQVLTICNLLDIKDILCVKQKNKIK